jgi:hypothetical protein
MSPTLPRQELTIGRPPPAADSILARVISRHLGWHIPHPNILVNNMPEPAR